MGLKIHEEKLTHEVKSLTTEDSFEEDRIIAYVPGTSFSKKKKNCNRRSRSLIQKLILSVLIIIVQILEGRCHLGTFPSGRLWQSTDKIINYHFWRY